MIYVRLPMPRLVSGTPRTPNVASGCHLPTGFWMGISTITRERWGSTKCCNTHSGGDDLRPIIESSLDLEVSLLRVHPIGRTCVFKCNKSAWADTPFSTAAMPAGCRECRAPAYVDVIILPNVRHQDLFVVFCHALFEGNVAILGGGMRTPRDFAGKLSLY
jgi:hypothetical protein